MSVDARQRDASMVEVGRLRLAGRLCLPANPHGVVLCIDETGSGLLDARHGAVAGALHDAAFATLVIDLLTTREHADEGGRLLPQRYPVACGPSSQHHRLARWRRPDPRLTHRILCYGVGCAVALAAAAERPAAVLSSRRVRRPPIAGPRGVAAGARADAAHYLRV